MRIKRMPTAEKSIRPATPDLRVGATVLGAAIVFAIAAWASWAFLEISVFPNLQSPWLLIVPLLVFWKYVKRLGPVLIHVVRNVAADLRRPPASQPATFKCARCGVAYVSPYYFRRGAEACTKCERRVSSEHRDEAPTA